MHPIRRQGLLIVVFVVSGIGLAVGLGLFALQENISLLYSPTQIGEGKAPQNQLIRAGGMVDVGSVNFVFS